MTAAKARKRAQAIVDHRLDRPAEYPGIGHSVVTVEAAVALVTDVLLGRAKA